MKKLLSILLSSLLASSLAFANSHEAAPAKPEVKKICNEFKIKGKVQKQCKNVKMHKKFEGTKVPTPAPKPKAPAKKKK
jgi:hypothetical protein